MPRELIVKSWCDVCYADGQSVEGREVAAVIADPEARTIRPVLLTVCEVHDKEYVAPLQQILEALDLPLVEKVHEATPAAPRKPPSKSSAYDPQTCEFPMEDRPNGICGFESKNRNALAAHVRAQHGLVQKDYRAVISGDVALPEIAESGAAEVDEPFPEPDEDGVLHCPRCEVSYAPGEVKSPKQALGLHMSKVHQLRYKRRR